MKLSVIIISKNEADHIGECLDSVSFADEIIVLDSGSTDATHDIVRARGATLAVRDDWPGFGPQKNRALDMASHDWVLSVDADERVTPELAQIICQTLQNPPHDGYLIARSSQFCGRWMRHSGWWPDHVLRLFRRQSGRFTDDIVHEKVVVDGSTAILPEGHFLHMPYDSLEELVSKLNRYSTEAAQAAFDKGRRTSLFGPFGRAAWTFLRIYLLRRGFLDGWQGLILAGMAACGNFFRYAKLYWLQVQARSDRQADSN